MFGSARDQDGNSRAHPVTDDVVGAISKNAAEMGFASAAEAVSLIRAWLIVEGEHDKRVIEHFFGNALATARIAILTLRGVDEAPSLYELGLIGELGKPLFVLFDNVRANWVTGAIPTNGIASREEKAITELRRQWSNPDVDLHVLPFPWPDIICALPEECVRAALEARHSGQSRRFHGWQRIVSAFTSDGGTDNFKRFALNQLQLRNDPGRFIAETLENCGFDTAPDQSLYRSIKQMLAELENGTAGGATR